MSKDNPENTICAAALSGLSISAFGDIMPCCEYEGSLGSLKDMSLADALAGEALAELREQLANGTRVKACWKCWQAEDAGATSLRNRMNRTHPDFADASLDLTSLPNPSYLDIRFSNLCTFRCRTCYHGSSSRWFADAKALGTNISDKALLTAFDNDAEGLSQIEEIGDNISEIYFAGGEPLLHKQHFDLLRWLIDHGRTDIGLLYNTCLSTLDFEKNDLVPLWRQFKSINIEASIDAIGKPGALIRKGFDWEVFKTNLARLKKELPDALLHFGVTVSALNIMQLVPLHQAIVRDCGCGPDGFHFHPVQEPQHYDIAILPQDIQEEAAMQIEAYVMQLHAVDYQSKTAKNLMQIVDRMDRRLAGFSVEDVERLQIKFRETTARLDKLRAEKTVDILPELRSLIDG